MASPAPVPASAQETMETTETPWHAAYPTPRTNPRILTCQELLQFFKAGKKGGREIILIDVRRNDFAGGSIRGSVNIPAQSVYPTLPALFELFIGTGIRRIIWFCGSSKGRGKRAAGWFADYVRDQLNFYMESYILEGGINAWVAAGGEYLDYVDGYEPEAWEKA